MKQIDPTRPNHILIGIGGTGGKVLKAFRKRLWEEFPKAEDRDKLSIGFVYVDSTDEMMNPTDPSWRVFGQNAQFQKDQFVNIKSIDLGQILDHPDNYPGLKRVISNPEMMRKTLGEVGAAAGQKRRAGRILFAANVSKYMAAVKGQYTKITEGRSGNGNNLHIHIFAGLAGGTGSGSIIDAVAQLRADAMFSNGESTKITVYAMVPELNIPAGCQAGRYHQNGYAALCELSAFNAGIYLPCDVRTGAEHVNVDTISKKRFSLMVYSNVNENGAVVNSFTELPKLLSDMVYFTIFMQSKSGITDNFLRGFTNENKNEFLIEYSTTSKGSDKEPARTKAVNSFGIKRIIYPEQRVVEHISYTLADNIFKQMAYNNYKVDFGYVNEAQRKDYNQLYIKNDSQMNRWMLDDKFFTLDRRILESDKKFEPIREFWTAQSGFYSYDDAKDADSDPLNYIEQFMLDKYKGDFRYKQGVEDYYEDKSNEEVLKNQAETIVEAIERDLYTQWYEGQLSLNDLMKISDAILVFLKDRRNKIPGNINEVDEKIEGYMQEMSDNHHYCNNLNMLQKLAGKTKDCFADHQAILADLYSEKTYRVALEFAQRLLSKLQMKFEEFHDQVQMFVGALALCMDEATRRISDRNQQQGNIKDMKQAVIEVREDDKVNNFEKSLLLNKNSMENLAGSLRRALVKESTYAHFNELVDNLEIDQTFDIVDEILGNKVRDIQSNESPKEKLIGINILQQLQKVLVTDDDMRSFAEEAVRKSGVFILLDDTECGKAFRNNPNPQIQPESVNIDNILITMPSYEGDDMLKNFAVKLERYFRNAFETRNPSSTIDINISSDTMNEITIVAVKSLFPIRALTWLPTFETEYKMLTENPNPLEAREAKVILHSEGDGTFLPPIMGEKVLTVKEFVPYFFLGAAMGILYEADDPVWGHGWLMTSLNKYTRETEQLFLTPSFTDLTTCQAMTDERRDEIQEKVDAILNNPTLTKDKRQEYIEQIPIIMRTVAKECSSTSSPKFQQFGADSQKAIDMLNK